MWCGSLCKKGENSLSIPVIAGLAAVIGGLLEGLVIFFLIGMLSETGAVRKNFKGNDIPVSTGLSFPFVIMMVFLIYGLLQWYDNSYHLYILALMSISFLGFIDDMLGQRDTLGFKGHFGALFRGRLTTGGLKAMGGGLISLFIAVFVSDGWINIIINTLILALFTNMLNLLDLRPGRAVKGFLFFTIVIIIIAGGNLDWLLLAPLAGAVLWYFRYDLSARIMMGDAGSNVLGFALGYLAITELSLNARTGILLFLIAMHVLTEKYSLTKIIEKTAILRCIDNMGRRLD
jgi:UDP-N-acetylmuramyl pentapeptide phosphotransferase/UDP-N-acetylglucosamine-1-phosphate transferase